MREHTEAIHPPRALWVPFILGRPFGVPGDSAFQRRVLVAALRLLEAPAGPVLADYPEDAPPPGDEPHRYVHTVHALDVEHLDLDANASAAIVGFNLRFHDVARAQIVPIFGS